MTHDLQKHGTCFRTQSDQPANSDIYQVSANVSRLGGVLWLATDCQQEKSVREKKQKKEERKRRKAAAKAAEARAGGEQDEENARVARPARKTMSDWRDKLGIGSGGGSTSSRAGGGRGAAGDVSSLVGHEKLVVEKREAYGDKFYRQVHLHF